jgi:phosphoglycolate phosphatase-like HAD superfamily hydrolase
MHAVIFDVDGTLLRSASTDELLYWKAVTEVLGPVTTRAALGQYDHITDPGILRQVFEDNGMEYSQLVEKAVRGIFEYLIRAHIEANGPFASLSGAREVLARLSHSSDYAVAIATGGWRSVAMLKLATSGFDLNGIPVATSDDSHDRLEIMKIAKSRLAGDITDILYVGDAVWDEAACRTLGWRFVRVGPAVGGIADFHEFSIRQALPDV